MMAFDGALNGLESTIVFVVVLSILIVVHEWGHFITAKWMGVDVKEFALGFGPTLFAKQWHGTNYMLKAFPLGGYVRMAGDERDKCTGAPDEFYSKSTGKRALIVLNGPVVNVILAYVSFVAVFMLGYPGLSTTITEVKSNSAAYQAGVRTGDKVIAIDSKKVYGWMHMERMLATNSSEPVELTFKRQGQEVTVIVPAEIEKKPNLLGDSVDYREIGIGFLPNKIGGVAEGMPAEEAGLQMYDEILEINGKSISNWTGIHKTITESKTPTVALKVKREDYTFFKTITPSVTIVEDDEGNEKEVRKIGIGPMQDFGKYKFSFGEALRYSYEELTYITILTYKSLYKMVTGGMSAKESVTGPVGIFYIVKGAAEEGISHLLFILGVISASLAIFNLLPMLPLDGGHIALLGIEKLRGKPLPAKVDDFVARLGFTFIILLALFVFYSDFDRFGWIEAVISFFQKIF